MDTTIIVPRDIERVLEFDIPAALMARITAAPGPCGLAISYLVGDHAISAAMHDYPPQAGTAPRTSRLRKRLAPPPPGLTGLRFAFTCDDETPTDADHIDVPAHAPDLADFARGSLIARDHPDAFAPGTIIALPLTLTNDSEYAWEPGIAGVALRLEFDGAVQTIPLPCTIPPGAARPIEIALQAPALGGERALICVPMLAPALPFARGRTFKPLRLTLTIAPPDTAPRDQPSCRIDIAPPASALLPAEPAIVALTLTNTGTSRIEASDQGCLRLRARWRREPREGSPIRDAGTALLPFALDPGASAIVALDVTAPDAAGRYTLDILAEQVDLHTRLDDRHADCPAVSIDVVDPATIEESVERDLRRTTADASVAAERRAYRHWAAYCDTLDDPAECAALVGLDRWPHHPVIAITLAGDLTAEQIAAAIAFLERQPYPAWRLHSTSHDAHADEGSDEGGDAGADLFLRWNPAEGRLANHALAFIAGEVVRHPSLVGIYGDFDHLDPDGQRHDRVFLPDHDPFFARAQPAMATIAAFTAPHDPRDGAMPAAMLDAALPPDAIAHIPHVLFHRHDGIAAPHLAADARVTGNDTNTASGPWRMMKMHDVSGYAVRAILPAPAPHVALIIPTRDRHDLLATFISTILERTDYPSFELIVVDNGSTEPETLSYLEWLVAQGHARVLRDDGGFNWSRLNNRAAAITGADILCFLNNDMEVTDAGWLTELAALAAVPDVGVAGATLWFPHGTIQHAGVSFTHRGGPIHPFHDVPRGTAPFHLRSLRSWPAVTGACLAVRRAVFDRVGGFDETFPLGFNDIDFCLRVRETLGLRAVCTPAAALIHKESASRGRPRNADDRADALHELAWFEGRHLETAIADRASDTIAHAVRRDSPLTMVTRPPHGARRATRRYRRIGTRPIAFVHMPRTGGGAVRAAFDRALPNGAMLSIGARAMVLGHEGDPATAARLAPLLREAEILLSPISHGFGAAIGWACDYATILRDPRTRVRSHHDCLVTPRNAPLRDTPLAGWSTARLLRKGVIPGNLMLAKILGEAPETVPWPMIDGRFPRYAGFRLPPALWAGDIAALAALPDVAPDDDVAKVARALDIIARDFVFVGVQEHLCAHLARFGDWLGVPTIESIPRINGSDRIKGAVRDELSPEDAATIDRYTALDRLLYDAIAARPGGMFLAPGAPGV